jgi:hypothetical protein
VGVLLDIEPRSVSAPPGGSATAQVRARNTGSVVDQLTFEVLGFAKAWTTVEPPTLSLFPGAEGTATITFAPPRSPAVPPGPMPFGLRAASKEDAAGSAVEEGVVDVGAFSDASLELVPRTSRGSTGATHDLAIDNRGNGPLSATLTALDENRLLSFELRPPVLNAAPGMAAFAKVRVKPAKTFWRGAPVSRPFQVQAQLPDAPSLTIDGSILQTPILPPWTFRALASLVAVAILAVAGWLAFLRPAIEATAREQANDVLAAAGITPGPSGAAGGAPSASPSAGGGAPSPSPSASTASGDPGSAPTAAPTTTPAPPAVSKPIDGRLLGGGPALTAPANSGLYLTDLVFSNPSATATGDIRLERSGQALLVLRLENFRDLDFHFVTPIVATAGQTLRLVCPTGCDGASLYYSGFQR